MVKRAEVIRKRNPLLPVFGIIIAVGLFIVAMSLVPLTVNVLNKVSPGFRVSGVDFSIAPDPAVAGSPLKLTMASSGRLGVAFAIWLFLLAIAYALVAVLAGKDPDTAKGIKLPPRDKRPKKF